MASLTINKSCQQSKWKRFACKCYDNLATHSSYLIYYRLPEKYFSIEETEKLLELRNIVVPGEKKLTWDEITRRYNAYFARKKTTKQLRDKKVAIIKKNHSPNIWTQEQCKALLIEMEKPGKMDHILLAKRSMFEGKDNKQMYAKTQALRVKKIALLSAAATLGSKKKDLA